MRTELIYLFAGSVFGANRYYLGGSQKTYVAKLAHRALLRHDALEAGGDFNPFGVAVCLGMGNDDIINLGIRHGYGGEYPHKR